MKSCILLLLLAEICLCFSARLEFRPFSRTNGFETNIRITNEHGYAAEFDGIGGVSGGGATSKLLVNYPEKQRNEILDYLFKPDYAASIQILKVEIGGDAQSTDGSEASHMHEPDSENYHKGYEWWLMKEAKKRNPNIKLYGLSWVFPGWLGDKKGDTPFRNYTLLSDYLIKWIKGAKAHHNLDIDYMGIWNERGVEKEFVYKFRKDLNKAGLSHIDLVMADSKDWGSHMFELLDDPEYLKSIDIIGQHYPGALTPANATSYGKKLWASEDFSSGNGITGGGCWARSLNEGYENGYYTAFIAWNLIASYYDDMPYSHNSLMTANQPWSGNYDVASPIWATAHHTFFYQPGWKYLPHGSGVGKLSGNGSYITLVSPDEKDMTIVIETLDGMVAKCRYGLPEYTVADSQVATFKIDGKFKDIKKLYAWYSLYNSFSNNGQNVYFEEQEPVKVVNGKFSLKLKKNVQITLTTVAKKKPAYPKDVPGWKAFPVPFNLDFEDMPIGEEPYYFSPQSGAYEVTMSDDPKHKKVMTQVVIRTPVDTCWTKMSTPMALIGNKNWRNTHVEIDAFIDKKDANSTSGVYLASNVETGGCDIVVKNGIYFWVNVSQGISQICLDYQCKHPAATTKLPKNLYNTWFRMSLDVNEYHIKAKIDNEMVFNIITDEKLAYSGFVIVGPNDFGRASFDNFAVIRAPTWSDED